jgi:CheY-like chemotaxis protein
MNNSLIVREEQTLIEQNLKGCIDYKTLYLNEDFEISDTFLSEVVKDIVNSKEYINIFIPLCFGPIMSDFNGLRLASHIRCTTGINQNKNIFIFSFVEINLLLNHECFDILKTKGVDLIQYNFHKIQSLVSINNTELAIEELPIEIQKLNLKIPTNYEDNHGIANEWAIYRWSHAIDASDDNIDKIIELQHFNLYFKYLKTVYPPISHLNKFNSSQLKINYKEHPRVLYIDDEAEKGWYEIFCKILDDENKLYFRHLDVEFNEKSKEEIIYISLKKVIDEDFDLVILDFRLHKDDFKNNSIEEVTGYQILKKIKEYNKGIQIVVFSATNKIWNLQALQEAGADGFILKESPELTINNTIKTIQNYVLLIQDRLQYCFEKQLIKKCNSIKNNLQVELIADNIEYNKFISGLKKQLVIITTSIEKIDLKRKITLDIVYLSCYNFLELFKEYYLKEGNDYRYYLGFEGIELNRFSISLNFNNIENQGCFVRNNLNDKPSWFNTISALFIDYFEVSLTPFNDVIKLKRIANKRNEYIHGDKLSFDKNELLMIIEALDLATKKIKE